MVVISEKPNRTVYPLVGSLYFCIFVFMGVFVVLDIVRHLTFNEIFMVNPRFPA
jgi:hypothetical protein